MTQRKGKSNGKACLVGGLLLAATTWLSFHFSASHSAASEPRLPTRAREVPRGPASTSRERSAADAAQRPPRPLVGVGSAPVIDRVSIDQSIACRDEALTVEVLAHLPDANNSGLFTLIDGVPGNPGVISFASEGDWVVPVLVYDRARPGAVARRELNVKIRDCDAREPQLELDIRRLARDGTHAFEARFPAGAQTDGARQAALRSATISWEFGDDAVAHAGSATTHRYEDSATPAAMRTFIVKAVTNIDGRTVRGKKALTVYSEYSSNKERGTITPEVRVTETRRSADAYRASLQISHFEPEPLHLESSEVSFVACDGSGESAPSGSGSPQPYLGTSELAPGRTTAELQISATEVPKDSCLAQFSFRGHSGAGEDVYFTASLTIAPTASERGTRQTDPARAQTLTRALTLLGREPRDGAVITDEELARLEQSGQL